MPDQTPPTVPAQNPVVTEKKSSSGNLILIILAIIVLIAIAFLAAYLFVPDKIPGFNLQNEKSALVDGGKYYFMSPDNSNLFEYGIYYSFRTTIEELQFGSKEEKIKITYRQDTIPLSNATLYFVRNSQNQTYPVNKNFLKKGQDIQAWISYNEKSGSWTTRNITILSDDFKSEAASSSAESR